MLHGSTEEFNLIERVIVFVMYLQSGSVHFGRRHVVHCGTWYGNLATSGVPWSVHPGHCSTKSSARVFTRPVSVVLNVCN